MNSGGMFPELLGVSEAQSGTPSLRLPKTLHAEIAQAAAAKAVEYRLTAHGTFSRPLSPVGTRREWVEGRVEALSAAYTTKPENKPQSRRQQK